MRLTFSGNTILDDIFTAKKCKSSTRYRNKYPNIFFTMVVL